MSFESIDNNNKYNDNNKKDSVNNNKIIIKIPLFDDEEKEETRKKSEKMIKCGHGCNILFKSERQKILHHDKIDYICSEEKRNLINLIQNFNLTLNKLLPSFRQRKKYKEYFTLVKQYKRTKKFSKDPIQFSAIILLK